MDNNITNKLTSSAQEALNEITEEIKNKIVEQAFENARLKGTSDKEISLSDILNAKEKLFNEKRRRDYYEYRKKRFTYLIGISGLIYAIIGLFIYVFQNKEFNLSSDIGLIIAAVGITMSIFVIFYQQLLSKRFIIPSIKSMTDLNLNIEGNDYDIVKKWQIIEKMARELMVKNGYDENKSNSFSLILNFLDKEIESNEQKNRLRELLKTRNLILHEDLRLERSVKTSLIKFSDEIIDLLDRKLK